MGTSYFFLEESTFPLIRLGRPPEQIHYSDRNIKSFHGPSMDLQVATATDQSLIAWNIDGSLRSGRVEFRDYDYEGSLKTIKFTDASCISYSEEMNPDSVMLPRLITLFILPDKMIYDGDYVIK